MKKFTFLKNAVILTITAFVLRGLGMLLRIYLSNKIGAEGMGLYQLIVSVYMMVATFATAGVSTGVIRVVSDEIAVGTKESTIKAFRKTLFLCICWGVFLATVLYFSAGFIGKYWINDVRTIPSLTVAIFALPFMSATSCIKGYFIAHRRVSIPSEAQILEQIVRLIIIFLLLDHFIPYGIDAACLAVMIGDVISEMSSCLYSYLAYRKEKKRHGNPYLTKVKSPHITKKMIGSAAPVALNKYLNTGLRTYENMLVPESLRQFTGSRETSLEQFGMLKGMAMPVLFFPSSLLTAFSTLLIPEMAEAKVLGNTEKMKKMADKTFHIAITLSILIGGIFFAFAYELAELIYHEIEIGTILKMLAPIVPFMYLETVVMGILQGLNEQMSSLKYNIFDSCIRLPLIFIFVPQHGLTMFIWIMILSNITTSSLNIYKTLKATHTKINLTKWILKPLIAISIAILVMTWVTQQFLLSPLYLVVIGSGIIMILYFTILLLSSGIQKEDFKLKD